jgi:hypothetical protein
MHVVEGKHMFAKTLFSVKGVNPLSLNVPMQASG